MPTKRRARAPARTRPPVDRASEIRRLIDEIAENAAVQIELLRHADEALRRVVTAIPPSTDDIAASQLIQAHNRVRRCARKGRDLARRLSALIAAAK